MKEDVKAFMAERNISSEVDDCNIEDTLNFKFV